jgi:hypothetical protein
VRYVHLLGIDQPVAVLDSRFPEARVLHYNWRGWPRRVAGRTGARRMWSSGGAGRLPGRRARGCTCDRSRRPAGARRRRASHQRRRSLSPRRRSADCYL